MLASDTAAYDAMCEATHPSDSFVDTALVRAASPLSKLTPALGRTDEADTDVVDVPLTAASITDAQIHELNVTAQKAEHMMSSATALGIQPESYAGHRADARARCAEILNTRTREAK